MENLSNKSYKTTAQGLGIAGLILGTLTVVISFIPCLGVTALIFGFFALVVSSIGLGVSIRHQQSKLLMIIALVLALIGSLVAGLQYFVLTKLAKQYPFNQQQEIIYTRDTDTIFSNSEEEDMYLYDQDTVVHDEEVN